MIPNLDDRFVEAVQWFWTARADQKQKQVDSGKIDAGNRGAVTGGTQMGAIEVLLTDILLAAGIAGADVHARTALELPGYYRPEKKWDLLVVKGDQLIMAVECKSQVGPSFGNNFNNRVEEAIGAAEDVWTAYRERRFGEWPPPFLGWLLILEDCPQVHRPIRNAEPYFDVDPLLSNSSYAQRYEVFCQRLMFERKYTATCLILATDDESTEICFPSSSTSFRTFAAALDAHAQMFANS